MQALHQSYPMTADLYRVAGKGRRAIQTTRVKPENNDNELMELNCRKKCAGSACSRVPLTWNCKQPLLSLPSFSY